MDGELGYAQVGETSVAYRVFDGSGDRDLLALPSGWLPMDVMYEDPVSARLLDGLRDLGRLVLFDHSGFGMSDPITDWDSWGIGRWADDVSAVISAAGLSDAVVIAEGFAAPIAAVAARRSDSIGALVLFEPYSPWFWDRVGHEVLEQMLSTAEDELNAAELLAPDRAHDPDFRAWFDHSGRLGASPAVRRGVARRVAGEEQRPVIRAIYQDLAVRTLLIRRPERQDGSVFDVSSSDLAEMDTNIAATTRVEVPGRDLFLAGAQLAPALAEIGEFVTGETHRPVISRSIEVILYTDLGGSTQLAGELGDERWRTMIDKHDEICHEVVTRRGGRIVKTTGDGILALLPSASAALSAAEAIRDTLGERDLAVRAGVHTGDVEHRGDDVSGLTVNIAARAMDKARPGEILATEAAVQGAIGAGFDLTRTGTHSLKGLPGEWTLYHL